MEMIKGSFYSLYSYLSVSTPSNHPTPALIRNWTPGTNYLLREFTIGRTKPSNESISCVYQQEKSNIQFQYLLVST